MIILKNKEEELLLDGDETVLLKILSRGMMTGFGHRGIRTPAVLDIKKKYLPILEAQGIMYEEFKGSLPKSSKPVKIDVKAKLDEQLEKNTDKDKK